MAGRFVLLFLSPELTLRAAATMLLRADPALWVSFLGGSPVSNQDVKSRAAFQGEASAASPSAPILAFKCLRGNYDGCGLSPPIK